MTADGLEIGRAGAFFVDIEAAVSRQDAHEIGEQEKALSFLSG